jgi:hypothetical protein
MSRGPGKIELGVLNVLARFSRITADIHAEQLAAATKRRWGKKRVAEIHRTERASLDAISIAKLVFRMDMFSRPTKAELGSVRRAIRRLAARGTLVEDPDPDGKRAQWLLANPDDSSLDLGPTSMTGRNTRQAGRG